MKIQFRREAIERVSRQQEEFIEAFALFGSKKLTYGDAVLEGNAKPMFYGDVKPKKPVITKCPACGSHEFRTHNLVRVCSYCRCAV